MADEAQSIRGRIEYELTEREDAIAGVFSELRKLAPVLEEISSALLRTLSNHGQVLTAGNGGSAAEAQHFAAELIGRFKRDRRPYPAWALTADSSVLTALGNDYGFDQIFARQLEGVARIGDAFVAFSTSGRSQNLVQAAQAGRNYGACTIAVTGSSPSPLADACDIVFKAPATDTALVQEVHLLFTHLVCSVLEERLTDPD